MGHNGWIAHAGLAISRPGGTADVTSLLHARTVRVACVEIDVVATADGAMTVRHDSALEDGRPVSTLTLSQLRAVHPETLILDEAMEILEGTPVLIDVKTAGTVEPLAKWLSQHARDDAMVCTEIVGALLHLRHNAPATPRWLSMPDVGTGPRDTLRMAGRELWRQRHPRRLARLGAELGRSLRQIHRPHETLGRVGGLPWRAHLPEQLRGRCQDVAASGLSLHWSLVSEPLCDSAHDLGLPVTAWTVNRPSTVAGLRACGVDHITTDDPEGLRRACGDG